MMVFWGYILKGIFKKFVKCILICDKIGSILIKWCIIVILGNIFFIVVFKWLVLFVILIICNFFWLFIKCLIKNFSINLIEFGVIWWFVCIFFFCIKFKYVNWNVLCWSCNVDCFNNFFLLVYICFIVSLRFLIKFWLFLLFNVLVFLFNVWNKCFIIVCCFVIFVFF